MSRLPGLFFEIVDTNGDPISGGKLYTYDSGTTNNKTTYSDAAKSVANTNPIVADAAGRIGPVYLTDNSAYTFVEKTAADVTLRSEDGVYSSVLSNNLTLLTVPSVSPQDFGGVGDGVTDDTDAINDALDSFSGWGVVDLLGLAWKCNSNLIMKTGVTLQNGKLDFSSVSSSSCITFTGSLGGNVLLAADATAGDNEIELASTSGIAENMLLNLQDTATAPGGGSSTNGEFLTVRTISAPYVRVNNPLYGSYVTTSGAKINIVTAVEDAKLKDLHITGPGSSKDVIYLANSRRITMERLVIDGGDTSGSLIHIAGCLDVQILDCSLFGARAGEAIYITKAAQSITIQNVVSRYIRSVVFVAFSSGTSIAQGQQRNILIDNLKAEHIDDIGAGTTSMVYFRGSCEYAKVLNSDIRLYGSAAGGLLELDGQNFVIENCTLYQDGSGSGIPIIADSSDTDTATLAPQYITFSNCKLKTDTTTAMDLSLGAPDFKTLTIENCTVEGGIVNIDTSSGTNVVPNLFLSGNRLEGLTIAGAVGRTFTSVYMSNNTINGIFTGTLIASLLINNLEAEEVVLTSISLGKCDGINIAQAALTGAGALVIDNSGITPTSFHLANSEIKANVASKHGVLATGMNNLHVTDCYLYNTSGASYSPFELAGTNTDCFWNNNHFERGDDLAAGLEVANVTNGFIDGNLFENGTYGINATGTNNVLLPGRNNQFKSMATGTYNGLTVDEFVYNIPLTAARDAANPHSLPAAAAAGSVLGIDDIVYGVALVSRDHDNAGVEGTDSVLFHTSVPTDWRPGDDLFVRIRATVLLAFGSDPSSGAWVDAVCYTTRHDCDPGGTPPASTDCITTDKIDVNSQASSVEADFTMDTTVTGDPYIPGTPLNLFVRAIGYDDDASANNIIYITEVSLVMKR